MKITWSILGLNKLLIKHKWLEAIILITHHVTSKKGNLWILFSISERFSQNEAKFCHVLKPLWGKTSTWTYMHIDGYRAKSQLHASLHKSDDIKSICTLWGLCLQCEGHSGVSTVCYLRRSPLKASLTNPAGVRARLCQLFSCSPHYLHLCRTRLPVIPLWSCCPTSPLFSKSASLTLPVARSSVSNCSLRIPLSTRFSQTGLSSLFHFRQAENYRQIKRAVFLYQGYRQSVRSGRQQQNINETNVKGTAVACSNPQSWNIP